ncbi:MAG: hypothetical protein OEM52_04575 [bacterium]|nr:hypothetical protein [bacterium]
MNEVVLLFYLFTPTGKEAKLANPDPEKISRVFQAMLPMKKLDITLLEKAMTGE